MCLLFQNRHSTLAVALVLLYLLANCAIACAGYTPPPDQTPPSDPGGSTSYKALS
jgi:hypothetical protein